MSGSHSLEKFINGVARDVQDPEKEYSVWQRAAAVTHRPGAGGRPQRSPHPRGPAHRRDRLRFRLHAFLDHLGIASLDLAYGGEDGGGIYHSIYDDFYWYTHFSDTDFHYARALAQTVGLAVMRLAGSDLLPYDFTGLADTMHKYTDELEKLWKAKSDEIKERNQQIEEGVFAAIADPKKTLVPPAAEKAPPFLNFAPLHNGLAALDHSAQHYQSALGKAALGQKSLEDVNRKLSYAERALTLPAGLPRRPWFQHMIYAPGVYTGYAVKTIPGVRERSKQRTGRKPTSRSRSRGRCCQRSGCDRGDRLGTREVKQAHFAAALSSTHMSCSSDTPRRSPDRSPRRTRRESGIPRSSPIPGADGGPVCRAAPQSAANAAALLQQCTR